MRTGGWVWLNVIQAEESSASVGHSDILGLSTFQSGGTKQEGVDTTRSESLMAGPDETNG